MNMYIYIFINAAPIKHLLLSLTFLFFAKLDLINLIT